MSLFTTLGGRKFVFALLIVISALTLSIIGKVTYDQFLQTALLAFGLFAAANVTQKFRE